MELLNPALATPRLWYEVLEMIQSCDVTAVYIAGGCLRDIDNDAPIKDVDIFVCAGEGPERDRLRALAVCRKWTENPAASYGDIKDIAGLWTFTQDSFEYNVILLDKYHSMQECVERMDFGICQIASDYYGVEWCTAAYLRDKANRTFTQTDPERVERSKRRFERLSEKYPGWMLVLPDGCA